MRPPVGMLAGRLIVLALCSLLLAACGSTPPHSDYFIVTFTPGTADPSAAGKQALANAVAEAKRASYIDITGAVPGADDPGGAMIERRVNRVVAALLKAGVEKRAIAESFRAFGPAGFAATKDNLILQLGYGERPSDRPTSDRPK